MTTCWQNNLDSHLLTSNNGSYSKSRISSGKNSISRTSITGLLFACLAALVEPATASGASNQLQPVLKAIDPSQAKYDTSREPSAQKNAQSGGPNYEYQPYGDAASPALDQSLSKSTNDTAEAQDNAQMWMTQVPVAPSPAETRALSRLEQIVFGTTYPSHDFPARIDHLETETLGSRSAESYAERLRRLNMKIGVASAFGPANQNSPPNGTDGKNASALSGNDNSRIIQGMLAHPKAGDYLFLLRSFGPNLYPHWSNFPVKVHLPEGSPDSWKKELDGGLESWNSLLPLSIVPTNQLADIDVIWVSRLLPRLLGITRLIVTNGRMHVQIFLLRPTFYLREVPEHALAQVFLHEMGHALGLTGHSDTKGDIMYSIDLTPDGKTTFALPYNQNNQKISPRDINTLKRLYFSAPIPPHFSLPTPVEFSIRRQATSWK